ncbi:6-deoxyerythronolide-B synthase EryA1, modules 1 and 2 [Antarctobacter heliothermus]|uniref:6-deoxyerythronolide-B synthase EryA1, modules 1 and 2 n=1 Tax=Antarctobacter heliothermus TaxID=74033 RepID=A0A222E797_9RHOB|nr:type I polyketide synthase [Antarctobacter heliothermus]ASP22066.1 6-deoxyerythronolide-B synthase EryA1, modules 1 and 2 [Antarctobacter heliothermus]
MNEHDEERSVAVIGMGCRFPGHVDTPQAFWDLLRDGRDAIGPIPPDRIEVDRLFDGEPAMPGHIMSRYGGYLDQIDHFDAGFFHVSPREAARMDPQQRLILETAWEAMEDSGTPADRLSGRRVGVFVGQWLHDFEMRLLADPEITDFEMTIGSGRYTIAGRLSNLLNLQGPSLVLDTACASSLTAVHLAVQSLRTGESAMAFAGGVNVILNPHITIGYSQARMMAPDGHCKFGDAAADGYVRSEGAGMILLKRLSDALADGDRIHAIIRGSALNNDGNSSGSFGRPSRLGQEALIAAAVKDAGVFPASVGYVEAHGTGTRTGDPEELAALTAVLGRDRATPLRVGSVKTNIGHTEGAAGIAGLMKAVLAVKTGEIPASLHFRTPTPAFDWPAHPVEVAAETTRWDTAERIAGISGFGISGSNAHVIVQSALVREVRGTEATVRHAPVLPVSADSESALRALALRHADLLESQGDIPVADWCAAAADRRSALGFRAAFPVADRFALVAALRAFGNGGAPALSGRAPAQGAPSIVFVAPGQGGQWVGMARHFLDHTPAFRAAITECETALGALVDWSLTEQLRLDKDAAGWKLDRIEVIQPVLAALAIGYARLWISLGVRPTCVIGHSMGEVAAAAISGRLSVADAMRVVVNRSALMARTSGQGGMALVELVGADLDTRLSPFTGRLSVAAYNSPRSCVISGDAGALDDLLAELERDGIFCRRINVDVASHGPQMAALAEPLDAALRGIAPVEAGLPMFSTVTGAAVGDVPLDAGYWTRNLCEPVRFVDAVSAALDAGASAFVELGPNPVLMASVEQILAGAGRDPALVVSERRDRAADEVLAEGIARLWVSGVKVDWAAYAPPSSTDIPLPFYPWQRERHWHEAADLRPGGMSARAPQMPEATRALLHEIRWTEAPQSTVPASPAPGSWLLLGDPQVCTPIAEALSAHGASARIAPLDAARAAMGDAGDTASVLVVAPDAGAGFLPVAIVKDLRDSGLSPDRLVFVTRGATLARGDAQPVVVDQAALVGAARVVAEEHPELAIRLIDAEAGPLSANSAAAIAAQALAADAEQEIALRGSTALVPRIGPMEGRSTLRPGFALRPDAAYLVTGGLSALGLRAASCLVRAGARHVVLLSRRPLPPRAEWRQAMNDPETERRISGIVALEAAGATVEIATADVSDETAMRALLAEREAALRPSIGGLVHLATAYDTRLATEMDRESYARSVMTKLEGARTLDRLFPELDLFVLYSSTMTFVPHQGLAGYAAANCGLDALAADRRARGQHALSVAWGPWNALGRAALDHVADEFEARGELFLEPEEGDALLSHLIFREVGPTVSCFRMDWARFAESRRGRAMDLFADLVAPGSGSAEDATEFSALTGRQRRKAAERFVPEAVRQVLSLGAGEVDLDRPLGHLGLNSLMAIELRNALEKSVGRPLPATLAWSYPTAGALIEYLAADAAAQPAAPPDTAPAAATPGDLAQDLSKMADMSDEEALAALMGGDR